MLAVPFSLVGAFWIPARLQTLERPRVGRDHRARQARAETGVVMLLFLDSPTDDGGGHRVGADAGVLWAPRRWCRRHEGIATPMEPLVYPAYPAISFLWRSRKHSKPRHELRPELLTVL